MTAPFFTGCIFFRRSGPGGGGFAGACRRGYFLGQSQSRAPSPAKRVSSSFLLAFGGEKSPIGDSQYGSPPGRSFYSCKRNQNTLGALPQDPCRWLCWIRIDLRRQPKSIRTAHRIAPKVACGSICPFPPPPFPRRERGSYGLVIRNREHNSRGVRACKGGRSRWLGCGTMIGRKMSR